MEVTKDQAVLVMNQKKKRKKKIHNKLTLEILVVTLEEILAATQVVTQVVAVELTQVAELILNLELVKELVDLEMVMDQDKVLDKV